MKESSILLRNGCFLGRTASPGGPDPLPRPSSRTHLQARAITLLALPLLLVTVGLARAEAYLPKSLSGVGFDQRLNQPVPLDATFLDEVGRSVKLGDYFGSKPVILVMAYYRCPMLCTEVLNGLVRALLDVPLEIGAIFRS